jgi:hypothetical protein
MTQNDLNQVIKNKDDQDDLIQEVIQHANHCKNLIEKMSETHPIYSRIDNYIKDDQNSCPFVLTAPSGAGKSSLMAFVAKKVILLYLCMYMYY